MNVGIPSECVFFLENRGWIILQVHWNPNPNGGQVLSAIRLALAGGVLTSSEPFHPGARTRHPMVWGLALKPTELRVNVLNVFRF